MNKIKSHLELCETSRKKKFGFIRSSFIAGTSLENFLPPKGQTILLDSPASDLPNMALVHLEEGIAAISETEYIENSGTGCFFDGFSEVPSGHPPPLCWQIFRVMSEIEQKFQHSLACASMAEEAFDSAEAKNIELLQKLEQAHHEIEELTKTAASVQSSVITATKEKIAESNSTLKTEINSLQELVNTLSEEILTTKKSLETAEETNSSLQKEHDKEMQAQEAKLRHDFESENKVRDEREQEAQKQTKSELAELKKELQKLREKYTKLKTEQKTSAPEIIQPDKISDEKINIHSESETSTPQELLEQINEFWDNINIYKYTHEEALQILGPTLADFLSESDNHYTYVSKKNDKKLDVIAVSTPDHFIVFEVAEEEHKEALLKQFPPNQSEDQKSIRAIQKALKTETLMENSNILFSVSYAKSYKPEHSEFSDLETESFRTLTDEFLEKHEPYKTFDLETLLHKNGAEAARLYIRWNGMHYLENRLKEPDFQISCWVQPHTRLFILRDHDKVHVFHLKDVYEDQAALGNALPEVNDFKADTYQPSVGISMFMMMVSSEVSHRSVTDMYALSYDKERFVDEVFLEWEDFDHSVITFNEWVKAFPKVHQQKFRQYSPRGPGKTKNHTSLEISYDEHPEGGLLRKIPKYSFRFLFLKNRVVIAREFPSDIEFIMSQLFDRMTIVDPSTNQIDKSILKVVLEEEKFGPLTQINIPSEV